MNNIILRYRLWERGEDSQRYSSFTSTPLKLVLYPTSFLSKHKIFKLKSKRYGTEKGTCKLCGIKVLWYWKKMSWPNNSFSHGMRKILSASKHKPTSKISTTYLLSCTDILQHPHMYILFRYFCHRVNLFISIKNLSHLKYTC